MYSVFSSPHIFNVSSPTAIKLFSFTLKIFSLTQQNQNVLISSDLYQFYTDFILNFQFIILHIFQYITPSVLRTNIYSTIVLSSTPNHIQRFSTHIFIVSSFPKNSTALNLLLHYNKLQICWTFLFFSSPNASKLGVFVCNVSSYLTTSL